MTAGSTIQYFYGEQPAQWLKSRVVHLAVRGLPGPRVPAGLDPAVGVEIPGAAPVLLDSLAAWLLPHLRAQQRDRRILVSVDDDWWRPRDWVRAAVAARLGDAARGAGRQSPRRR